jgi:hypothetical protein
MAIRVPPAAKPATSKPAGSNKAAPAKPKKDISRYMMAAAQQQQKHAGMGQMDLMMQLMSQVVWPQGWEGEDSATPAANESQVNHKGALQQMLQKAAKKAGTEFDKPEYTVVDVTKGKIKLYKGTVTFQGKTFEGPPSQGKKAAEHAAAKAAADKAFPGQVLSKPSGGTSSGGSVWVDDGILQEAIMSALSGGSSAAPSGKGVKRSIGSEELPAKTRLVHAVQLLVGRPVTKEDIVYKVEGEVGAYLCSVSIPHTGNTYAGSKEKLQKAAEASAAEVALKSLKDKVAPLEEEHKAKKAKANKEAIEALKEKMAAKKAAKKAADKELV